MPFYNNNVAMLQDDDTGIDRQDYSMVFWFTVNMPYIDILSHIGDCLERETWLFPVWLN